MVSICADTIKVTVLRKRERSGKDKASPKDTENYGWQGFVGIDAICIIV